MPTKDPGNRKHTSYVCGCTIVGAEGADHDVCPIHGEAKAKYTAAKVNEVIDNAWTLLYLWAKTPRGSDRMVRSQNRLFEGLKELDPEKHHRIFMAGVRGVDSEL